MRTERSWVGGRARAHTLLAFSTLPFVFLCEKWGEIEKFTRTARGAARAGPGARGARVAGAARRGGGADPGAGSPAPGPGTRVPALPRRH